MIDMQSILDDVMSKVSQRALNLLRDIVIASVYEPNKPSVYQRRGFNGGFVDGWSIESKKAMNNVIKEVFYDMDKMNSTGAQDGFKNRDEWLPSILNDPVLNREQSDRGGALNIREDHLYWDLFMEEIDKNIWKWFDEEFKKYGIVGR